MDTDIHQSEVRSVKKEIDKENVAALSSTLKGDLVLKGIVSEYLSHKCYTDSGKAFAEDLKDEAVASGMPDHSQTQLSSEEGEQHALTRRRRPSPNIDDT